MNTVALIPARGGSKGLPGKNIRLLAGKPMLAWTIEAARGASGVGRVVVSTDDPEIARVAVEWGAEAPFLRPAELALDTSSSVSVACHFLDWLGARGQTPDYLLFLQPTSPLRTAGDIESALELADRCRPPGVIGVSEIDPMFHPWFAKRIEPGGRLADFDRPEPPNLRRQDLPAACAVNGSVYLCQSGVVIRDQTLQPAGALACVLPAERALDVDTARDFFLADLLLKAAHGHH